MKRKALMLVLATLVPSWPTASAAVIGHYRFEEGSSGAVATTVLDTSVPGGNHGIAFGDPLYFHDVPPYDGANGLSLEFDPFKVDYVRVNSQFPLHQPGDVTMEFWLKAPSQGHAAIFWSRLGSDPDANRFHIFLWGGTDAGPGAPLSFGIDYREPNGIIHPLLGGLFTPLEQQPFVITPGVWTHVAIVRESNTYRFYKNGGFVWQTEDVMPNLPDSVGWEIAGRSHDFHGRIDEIRFSDRALAPSEFLYSIPEPSSVVLAFVGLAVAAMRRL